MLFLFPKFFGNKSFLYWRFVSSCKGGEFESGCHFVGHENNNNCKILIEQAINVMMILIFNLAI